VVILLRVRGNTNKSLLLLVILLIVINFSYIIVAQNITNITQERHRPLVGGIQIEFWKEILYIPIVGSVCTLGFPVYRSYDDAYGVITAGHCNNWEYGGWYYDWVQYQPTLGDDNIIGTVNATSCSAEATLVLFNNVHYSLIHIYEDNSYDSLYITGWVSWDEIPSNYVNVTFYKTGRTTGTTSGTLQTWEYKVAWGGCYVYRVLYLNYTSEAGDSGSPVYVKLGDHAIVVGYHIGRSGDLAVALSVDNLWDTFGVRPYVCYDLC